MRKLSNTKRRLLQSKTQIVKAYQNNWSLRNLAGVYQTHPNSIRALLIEEGVTLRKPGRRKKEK